jgi:hypothetical protein
MGTGVKIASGAMPRLSEQRSIAPECLTQVHHLVREMLGAPDLADYYYTLYRWHGRPYLFRETPEGEWQYYRPPDYWNLRTQTIAWQPMAAGVLPLDISNAFTDYMDFLSAETEED